MVDSKSDCMIPPEGKVDLIDKQYPICFNNQPYKEFYAYTRTIVDIKPFKEKLNNLPKNYWTKEIQDTVNVNLIRPAHDQWGIEKLLFTFCDDYLLSTYNLPLARDPEFSPLINQIYKQCNIDSSQVVRCLLAKMPPNSKIPVHHDTGLWVKHTHRCHIAIETNDEIDFLVGPNENLMKKYMFTEGHVIELNNQAKHAVINNSNDFYRIHLIFDYIEIDSNIYQTINRKIVEPKTLIRQTRRSIDLNANYKSRKLPTYIIIGAQKCGTTYLYELLSQHGLAVKGKKRESHFFDWNWINKDLTTQERFKLYEKFYESEYLYNHPSLFTGESTPSYMLHSDITLPRIKALVPWAKLLVMLRNPVDRAFSQYNMCIDLNGTPEQLKVRGQSKYIGKTFEQVIDDEINELEKLGLTAESSYESFKSKYLSTCHYKHGGHSLIVRGLYHLQLIPWLTNYQLNDNIYILELTELNGTLDNTQSIVNNVLNYLTLPLHDIEDNSPKNARSYCCISEQARKRLVDFYRPYNEKLFELLGKSYDWN